MANKSAPTHGRTAIDQHETIEFVVVEEVVDERGKKYLTGGRYSLSRARTGFGTDVLVGSGNYCMPLVWTSLLPGYNRSTVILMRLYLKRISYCHFRERIGLSVDGAQGTRLDNGRW